MKRSLQPIERSLLSTQTLQAEQIELKQMLKFLLLKLILREDNNWQLSHNPHYKIVNQPAINPFLNDRGILSFSNIHNPQAFKFPVPFSEILSPEKGYLKTLKKEPTIPYENKRTGKLEGSHTFFEVDCVNGELKTESVEGKIQLAQIFLAQKECQQAFFYLDQIRDGDSLSDESRRVLFSILDSRFGAKMKDSSGNMEAIRLKA